MAAQVHTAPRIIRRPKVEDLTGLPRSTIYAKLKYNPKRPGDYDPSFPRPVKIGSSRTVGWIESEVEAWIGAQIQKSRAQAEAA